LLADVQAMHLWVFAKSFIETPYPLLRNARAGNACKLCSGAVRKLSRNKPLYLGLYQIYVETPNGEKIKELHQNNTLMLSIVTDFVQFYYKGNLERAVRLLKAGKSINRCDVAIRILTSLHEEMVKHEQLSSFEAVRLFNEVKRYMSFCNSEPDDIRELLEQFKKKAFTCVSQLLWQESNTKFLLVNKFFKDANLQILEDGVTIVCFATSGAERYSQTWRIAVDSDTSLLTLTNTQNAQEKLDVDGPLRLCLTESGMQWMVKAIDKDHVKIYCYSSSEGIHFIIHTHTCTDN
jgi:hypothetical protein